MRNFLFRYQSPTKQTLKLAMPIMAGQLGHILMGFFDTIQIGGLGAEYIAAAGVAHTIYWFVTLLGIGVLFGIAPLVSEAFGEGKGERGIGIFRSSIWLSIWLSVFFTTLMFIVVQRFEIFGQTGKVNDIATRYLFIVNFSTPAMLLFTAGRQLVDGIGRTVPGMLINLGALAMNVFLNWLLIYGHWGFPAWGIEGAAWATSISRMVMMAAIFTFIWRDTELQHLRKSFKVSEFRTQNFMKPVLIIGVPASLQIFSEAASFCTAHIMCGWLGEIELAAHQIAINLASITFMAVTGISSAGTIMTGFAFGAKDKSGIRVNGNTAIMLTIALELVFMLFFFSAHSFLPRLYTDNQTVIAMASSLILLAVFFQLSDGLQNSAVGVLRGIQDVKIPALLAFTSYWLVMIPTCYLLAFRLGFGVRGIWLGFIIGLSTAAVLLLSRFKYLTTDRKLFKLLNSRS